MKSKPDSASTPLVDLLLENIPDMIFVKDARSLRFVRLNRAGERLIGRSREQIVGKTDHDLFPPEEADFFVAQDRRALETRQRVDIPEEPLHTSEGLRYLHTKKIPVFDEAGTAQYLLGISEDVTELRLAHENRLRLETEQRAREDAERNVRLRDEFLSIASHELRTPLTPLKLQIQLLRRSFPADSSAQRSEALLRAAEDQVDRLTLLIDGLLDVSRITAGRLVPHRTSLDLRDLTLSVVGKFRAQLDKSGCSLEVHASEPIVGAWDATQIERVITSLMTNAIKFGRGAPLELFIRQEIDPGGGRAAVIQLRDHGMGIAAADQQRIFQRFERAVTEAHFGGLGLGLYISREIVAAHGGKLSVESSPGEGATFTVRLPIGVARSAPGSGRAA